MEYLYFFHKSNKTVIKLNYNKLSVLLNTAGDTTIGFTCLGSFIPGIVLYPGNYVVIQFISLRKRSEQLQIFIYLQPFLPQLLTSLGGPQDPTDLCPAGRQPDHSERSPVP